MKLPKFRRSKKVGKFAVKALVYPFKKLADEDVRKKLFDTALLIGVAYAEAKLDGRGDEFIVEMRRQF